MGQVTWSVRALCYVGGSFDGGKSVHSARRVAQHDAVHRASVATQPMGRFSPPLRRRALLAPGVVSLHLWWDGTTACNPPSQ